jgi:hypothetical protein
MSDVFGKLIVVVSLSYLAFHVIVDFDVISKLFFK